MFGEKGDGAWFTLEDPEEDERKSLLRSNLQKLIPILKREKFKLTDEEYKVISLHPKNIRSINFYLKRFRS